MQLLHCMTGKEKAEPPPPFHIAKIIHANYSQKNQSPWADAIERVSKGRTGTVAFYCRRRMDM